MPIDEPIEDNLNIDYEALDNAVRNIIRNGHIAREPIQNPYNGYIYWNNEPLANFVVREGVWEQLQEAMHTEPDESKISKLW